MYDYNDYCDSCPDYFDYEPGDWDDDYGFVGSSWTELMVTLDTAGVVVLDTSHVPDVLGFTTRNADTELVGVLPGRARDSVRALIPDVIP